MTLVRQLVSNGLNTPRARGVGRYFDAFGAILLSRPVAQYEGQVAFELNMAADPHEHGAYSYGISRTATPIEIDLRPVVHAAVDDLISGVSAATIAARFHNTMINATAAAVRIAARHLGSGRQRVVLTGGCFQNARLAEGTAVTLRADHDVYLHHRVPPGDGGIALGQAAFAAAQACAVQCERRGGR